MIKFLSIILFVFFVCFTNAGYAADGWEIQKNCEINDIKIYTRYVEGSSIKAFMAVTHVKASLSSLVALFSDVEANCSWHYSCLESKVLRTYGHKEQYIYEVLDTPWPVASRDMVVHAVSSQNPKTFEITISLNAAPDYITKDKGHVRVETLSGYWKFIPLNDGIVKVIYQLHLDPNGSIPIWLVNSTIIDAPYETMKKMKEIIQTDKYRLVRLNYVKEPPDKIVISQSEVNQR